MGKVLRVLNVEDSERDVEIICRHLSAAGYDLFAQRVETADAMKTALDTAEWDIILCDYSMPRFNALSALAVLHNSGLDIPFIIISGTVGEELAVEAMLTGSDDYLPKDNLTRLVPAIRRELEEAENRHARRGAEERLRASEVELLALFEAMTDVIIVLGADGRFRKIAPTHPAFLYKPASELIDKTVAEVFPVETAELFLDYVQRALATGRTEKLEYSLRIDGKEVWFEGRVSPMTKDSVVWVARDITERRQSAVSLQMSEERYRDLVENAMDIIYTHDLAGNYTSVNKAGEKITGYTEEESLTMNLVQSVAPEYREKAMEMIAAKLAGDDVTAYELEIAAKDGHRVPVEVNTRIIFEDGVPAGVQGIARDITERKELEEQFLQSQKMEALGLLAGGIAHDFNNLLTAISGYSQLIFKRMSTDDPLRLHIKEIMNAGERAAGLTNQLLAFSRKQVLRPRVHNLNAVIAEIEKMLRRIIRESIEFRTILDPELGNIRADPGQIEQVIMNLAVNARDAMPGGGTLTIETQNVGNNKDKNIEANQGRFVRMIVTDTGEGMDELTQRHMFEPFFTTKEIGKGTGLGLSTAHGIVKQSGGDIRVRSEVGRGTTFEINFPMVVETVEKPKWVEDGVIHSGTETILLVEDEEMVRNLVREILVSNGYKVLDAVSGKAALSICQIYSDPIHLLLTDVVMPRMSGLQLKEHIGKIRPEVKLLFMSGHTDDSIAKSGIFDSDAAFIEKPFTPDSLLRKICEVLES
jgi:PAS domain S-box-containing protein